MATLFANQQALLHALMYVPLISFSISFYLLSFHTPDRYNILWPFVKAGACTTIGLLLVLSLVWTSHSLCEPCTSFLLPIISGIYFAALATFLLYSIAYAIAKADGKKDNLE